MKKYQVRTVTFYGRWVTSHRGAALWFARDVQEGHARYREACRILNADGSVCLDK